MKNIELKRLNPADTIRPFDCGDADLNGFLLEENPTVPNATHHSIELLATTYLIEDPDANNTIAYFSLSNDTIDRTFVDKATWNRLSRDIPNLKRRSTRPAVKLGRLGVSIPYQSAGWGTKILNFLKDWFTNENKTGCRYITVDALVSKISFYEKNGFKILVKPAEDDETVLMYYDLKKFEVVS